MTVSLYQKGDELIEGNIAVEGHFEHLDSVKVALVKGGEVLASYVVFRNVGDPSTNEHYQAIMELSNASSVNLWYECEPQRLTLVRDVERVTNLEQCLRHFEAEHRSKLQ